MWCNSMAHPLWECDTLVNVGAWYFLFFSLFHSPTVTRDGYMKVTLRFFWPSLLRRAGRDVSGIGELGKSCM